MRTLIDFSILQEYNEEVLPRGDKLSALYALVNWNCVFADRKWPIQKTKVKKAEILASS